MRVINPLINPYRPSGADKLLACAMRYHPAGLVFRNWNFEHE